MNLFYTLMLIFTAGMMVLLGILTACAIWKEKRYHPTYTEQEGLDIEKDTYDLMEDSWRIKDDYDRTIEDYHKTSLDYLTRKNNTNK